MKIYTKTGDDGSTSLFGGTRISKSHLRLESYGTVDELNSWIGLICAQPEAKTDKDILFWIQEKLFTVGAILATEVKSGGRSTLPIPYLQNTDVLKLENAIDEMDEKLPVMTHFILPGGHTIVSYCHIARTICRRAERAAMAVYELEPFDQTTLHFINRLSDFLFVLGRKLAQELRIEEIKWIPERK